MDLVRFSHNQASIYRINGFLYNHMLQGFSLCKVSF